MPHHPFPPEDAPYMQAYSQVLLENDYQTHQLLSKLMRADSPTFHNFGKKPPADVLDLGCGEGFWVLHAAKLWKSNNTRVVGLDLIDMHTNEAGEVHPHLEPVQSPKNVVWERANFVKHPLPFPDNSFDLVRMANLTLCIPASRWKFVLTQVRRVLRPGGRLELIDDDLFFPTILPRPSRDIPRSPSKRQWQRAISADNVFGPLPSSSLPEKPLPDLPSARGSPGGKKNHTHTRTQSDVEFSANSAIATHLETVFQNMLVNNYDIAARPHAFLEHMLRDVFGQTCARRTQTLELAVPSRELSEGHEALGLRSPSRPSTAQSSHSYTHAKRPSDDEKRSKYPLWMSLEWERKEKPSAAASCLNLPVAVPLPGARSQSQRTSDETSPVQLDPRMLDSLTSKARQLLLGDANTLDSRTMSWKAMGSYQPPGLVLLPSTLIPCTPLELEMHACKHMNTLLGCKDALSKYVTAQSDKHGKPLVSERELDDFLWDYECFRRKRLNWPQDVPGLQLENDADESAPPSPPPAKTTIFKFNTGTHLEPKRTVSIDGLRAQMYGGVAVTKQSSTHVRTIRVYEALKSTHHCSCQCGAH
ncbi:S-adenosyl-L-methionine-dependent methyltransferase [Ganoderma leucocontextum]|nr:S-adenosyl-L-methionine-dependent methyltransferase [Ganoderma leucocontextum]